MIVIPGKCIKNINAEADNIDDSGFYNILILSNSEIDILKEFLDKLDLDVDNNAVMGNMWIKHLIMTSLNENLNRMVNRSKYIHASINGIMSLVSDKNNIKKMYIPLEIMQMIKFLQYVSDKNQYMIMHIFSRNIDKWLKNDKPDLWLPIDPAIDLNLHKDNDSWKRINTHGIPSGLDEYNRGFNISEHEINEVKQLESYFSNILKECSEKNYDIINIKKINDQT